MNEDLRIIAIPYQINDLYSILEEIKEKGEGTIDIWETILCITKEIIKINEWIEQQTEDSNSLPY